MPSVKPQNEAGYKKFVGDAVKGLRAQATFLRYRGSGFSRQMRPDRHAACHKAAKILDDAAALMEQRIFADFGEE